MSISQDNDRLVVIIDKNTKWKLADLARNEGRSLSNFANRILTEYVNDNYKDDKED